MSSHPTAHGASNPAKRYVGCYANSEDDSVMGEMIERVDMTPSICREHCEGTGSLFYGTQVGRRTSALAFLKRRLI